jgi:hypothetical protein
MLRYWGSILVLLVGASGWGATTESIDSMVQVFQRLGPNGPTVILRDVHEDLLTSTSLDSWKRCIVLHNMVDFCTSPPIMEDNPPIPDYAQFARLSEEELKILQRVAEKRSNILHQQTLADVERWFSGIFDSLGGLPEDAPTTRPVFVAWDR